MRLVSRVLLGLVQLRLTNQVFELGERLHRQEDRDFRITGGAEVQKRVSAWVNAQKDILRFCPAKRPARRESRSWQDAEGGRGDALSAQPFRVMPRMALPSDAAEFGRSAITISNAGRSSSGTYREPTYLPSVHPKQG